MLVVEPLGPDRLARLFEAASVAYRTPLIGRKLYGAFRAAGLREVRVEVRALADTLGVLSPVLHNMASYARASGRMDPDAIDRLLDEVRRSIDEGSYLLVLPQFLVTGTA
jgi:hypothetical protein